MRLLFNRYLVFLVACSLPALLALFSLPEPVHAAPPAQASGAYGVAQYDAVNVRTGPSTAYPTVGQMSLGQSCPILGRDTYSGWYLLQCSTALTGWVAPELIAIVGNPATIPLYSIGGSAAPPEQQVPPPPATFAGWKASYFANKDLQGSPVLIQDVQAVNFDWGYGSPGPQVPNDYFSARYERTLTLPAGYYNLGLRMDDGARLLIDNQVVMSDWRTGALREMNTVRYFDGAAHQFLVEYFEDTGQAAIQFYYTATSAPAPTPGPVPGGPQPPPSGGGSIPRTSGLPSISTTRTWRAALSSLNMCRAAHIRWTRTGAAARRRPTSRRTTSRFAMMGVSISTPVTTNSSPAATTACASISTMSC